MLVNTDERKTNIERSIEEKVQSLLDGVIGTVVLLCVSAELTPGAPEQGGQSIARLSIALTVDRTKIVIDPETHEIREELRPTAEITRLTMLAKAAAGFVPARGDFIVVEAESFDKAQAIQRREQAVSAERKQ